MLAELMVGRAVPPAQRRAQSSGGPGALVCELRAATLLRSDAPRPMLDAVSLTLRAGEMVAIAGVAGNGQDALADVLCGLHALDGGTLTVNGAALPASPRAWVEAGVARIPEDRHAVGVVGDLPVWENAVLERFATPAFSRWGVVRRASAQAHARTLIERFDVRGTEGRGVETPTRALSGGNMQKLILGRALMTTRLRRVRPGAAQCLWGADEAAGAEGAGAPVLIVANQPTWGLDIGAVAYVHQQLLDACAAGAAVLLISEDLDEIFALADRIAVMHHGQLTAAQPAVGVDAGRDRPRDDRRRGGHGAGERCCGLRSAPCRRARRCWSRRSPRSRSRSSSPRCSSPGPARRSAVRMRCCSKAASARASRGPRR